MKLIKSFFLRLQVLLLVISNKVALCIKNIKTGEVKQIEYTPEEQAAYDAAIAAQQAEAQAVEVVVTQPTQ